MKKLIFGILIAFGLVSVSFGAWIPEDDETNYQKLKAEMEKEESSWSERWQITCSWDEDGNVVTGGRGGVNNPYNSAKGWCELKNVLAFVDEYRANKGKGGIYTYNEVEKMPRFKNDSAIYGWKSIGTLLKKALEKWKETKLNLEMRKLY